MEISASEANSEVIGEAARVEIWLDVHHGQYIEPFIPTEAMIESTATSPGVAGSSQATDRGDGHAVDPEQEAERRDVGGGKRPLLL